MAVLEREKKDISCLPCQFKLLKVNFLLNNALHESFRANNLQIRMDPPIVWPEFFIFLVRDKDDFCTGLTFHRCYIAILTTRAFDYFAYLVGCWLNIWCGINVIVRKKSWSSSCFCISKYTYWELIKDLRVHLISLWSKAVYLAIFSNWNWNVFQQLYLKSGKNRWAENIHARLISWANLV